MSSCCDKNDYQLLYLQEDNEYLKEWQEIGMYYRGTVTLHQKEKSQRPGNSIAGIPVLRAAVVDYPPLTMKTPKQEGTKCQQGIECHQYVSDDRRKTISYCCYGLAIDVLKEVRNELQFSPYLYFVPDGNYGSYNSTTRQWNGIVKELLDGKCDISIDLMANEARSRYIDFSLRWTFAGLALLFKVGQKKVELIDFSFFRPFTPQLWLGMISVVNLYLLVLWITDTLSPYGSYRGRRKRKRSKHKFTILGSMWFSWGMCFDNQFVHAKPQSYSARTMAVFLAMFALLCLTSYTANLTAHLLSDDTKPGISGIRDLKVRKCSSLVSICHLFEILCLVEEINTKTCKNQTAQTAHRFSSALLTNLQKQTYHYAFYIIVAYHLFKKAKKIGEDRSRKVKRIGAHSPINRPEYIVLTKS